MIEKPQRGDDVKFTFIDKPRIFNVCNKEFDFGVPASSFFHV